MAFQLFELSAPAQTILQGNGAVQIAAGKRLRIETTPDGEELLDVPVPSGKTWAIRVHVYVDESDA